MNILVTGGKGFIGSRLVDVLKKKGHNVECFDSADGKDILDFDEVKRALKGKDAVFHLAAVLDEDSPKLWDVNVKGTENVLEAAAKQGVGRIICLSTVGVMGDIKERADENTAMNPVTEYEKSKAKAEEIAQSYQELIPVTIIRAAMVYGPNEYWRKIIGLVKKGFPVIGSGKNHFQLIYVDDLVDALCFVLEKEVAREEAYIVAGHEEKTLKETYIAIQSILGVRGKVKSIPVFLGSFISRLQALRGKKDIATPEHIRRLVRERLYDTRKINSLGWKAKNSLEEGMRKTIGGLEGK